jgi:hypothetical protein
MDAGSSDPKKTVAMAFDTTKLGRKQEQAIAALMTQRNVDEAAKAAGVGVRTLWRWLKIPEFQAAYREARRTAFSQAIARLQQGGSAAATTLIKIMVDPKEPAAARVRAADCILSHGVRAIEIEDLAARLDQLERVAGLANSDGDK